MDLHHLRIFVSVFKHGSFSKASRELSLSQPTVSDHIQNLENELGCGLFDRLGRTILPTKEAEVLNRYAREIIEKADTLGEVIGSLKKEIGGELILGASSIPGTYLLPHLMASFLKKYPSISFQVTISDSRGILEKVIGHELFLGIVGAEIPNAQVTYAPLIEDELIAVASPSMITKSPISLQDLLHYPIVSREKGSGTLREAERILEEMGLAMGDLRVAGIFGSTEAVKQAVKAGIGISILSKISVTEELKQNTLKELKIKGVQMERKIVLVTRKKKTLPLAYRAFVDHVFEEMKRP